MNQPGFWRRPPADIRRFVCSTGKLTRRPLVASAAKSGVRTFGFTGGLWPARCVAVGLTLHGDRGRGDPGSLVACVVAESD